ncbi:MAG TPA: cation transporter [Synechococcales cyanobacterium M55_K2018_004]|nr:cation transporter [Synechococcales cyanobacterium M55_K2018_004]
MTELNHRSLSRRGLWLEYFTVAYNVFEAIVSIAFGAQANSAALLSFGIDSIVESLSALVLIWRLGRGTDDPERERQLEKIAIRLVAITFFVLGAYVLFDAATGLFFKQVPEVSLPGIVIAVLSTIVMPLLASQKHRIGQQIGSKALIADSRETLACASLSVALLVGLLGNALFGLWWMDGVAALVIGTWLVREGFENWYEASEEEDED